MVTFVPLSLALHDNLEGHQALKTKIRRRFNWLPHYTSCTYLMVGQLIALALFSRLR